MRRLLIVWLRLWGQPLQQVTRRTQLCFELLQRISTARLCERAAIQLLPGLRTDFRRVAGEETCLTIAHVEDEFIAAAPFRSLNYGALHSRPSDIFV